MSPMAMGKRQRHAKQLSMWVATNDLPRSAAHPFYTRLKKGSTSDSTRKTAGQA
jgi:hypothetical protein